MRSETWVEEQSRCCRAGKPGQRHEVGELGGEAVETLQGGKLGQRREVGDLGMGAVDLV